MARLPRLYAPQTPQLVLADLAHSLGEAGAPLPVEALDQLRDWLAEGLVNHRLALHGWILLDDRIILLSTPEDMRGIPNLMQDLGRRIAARWRKGRVYRGRYRNALLEPGQWVVPAMLWLESQPTRRRLVDKATFWPWSSAANHAGQRDLKSIPLTDHADYWALGDTPFARQDRYRQRLEAGQSAAEQEDIEQALYGQWALGSDAFLAWLRSQGSRRSSPAPRGRPRKADQSAG